LTATTINSRPNHLFFVRDRVTQGPQFVVCAAGPYRRPMDEARNEAARSRVALTRRDPVSR